MSFQLKWDSKKNKMVKVRKKEKYDDIKGTYEEQKINEGKLKKYIKSDFFRNEDFNSKTLKKELPISRKDRDISVDVYIHFLEDYLNRLKYERKTEYID